MAWLRSTGRIHAAGPRHWQRYYLDAVAADAAHDALVAQARDHVRERKRAEDRRSKIKQRAQRHHAGAKPVNTRTADIVDINLPPGVVLHAQVRVTIAPAPRDRFAPEPGFFRAITADYMLRRQGVQEGGSC